MPDPKKYAIQLMDKDNNQLLPKSKAKYIEGLNDAIEAKITLKTVKVDGVALTPDANKAVDVHVPTYAIAEAATAQTGYLKSYYLTKDGTQVGSYINIPKDFLVKRAGMGICETADEPLEGLAVGDPYLYFVVNTKDAEQEGADATTLYINVAGLVDVYTEGLGININAQGQISIDLSDTDLIAAEVAENGTKLVNAGLLYSEIAKLQGAITVTANKALISDANGKVAASNVSATELGYLSGVTSSVQDQINGKVDKLSTKPTAGSYTKITINAEGQVTSGTTLAESDIPDLHLAKVTDVTASASEVNQLHEAGAIKSDFEKLHATTATAAELNILDGATLSTDELNILDGVTANKDEINILDGATLTTTELNYVDGVTSSIQDQIDGKQATLTWDAAPTQNSTNAINSGAIYNALSASVYYSVIEEDEE